MPKGKYFDKPSVMHSDNPKMNKAELPDMGEDEMPLMMVGYAMGGMVGGDPTMPVRNQLTATAKMREAMEKKASE